MEHDLTALLVHDQEEPFRALEQVLRNLGIHTQHAHTCSEASAALRGPSTALSFLDRALSMDQ